MDFVYIYFYGSDWEDTIIFLSQEDAIKESINNPTNRIEVFSKTIHASGYTPTYDYYINGKLIQSQ
jgi:hypothetical protein